MESTAFAGVSYTLNCTVVSELRPVVNWIDPVGNPVNDSDITLDQPVYYGKNTYVLLRFHALRTSQAGEYTCQSGVVSSHLSLIWKSAAQNVTVTGNMTHQYYLLYVMDECVCILVHTCL